MRRILFCLLLVVSFVAQGQQQFFMLDKSTGGGGSYTVERTYQLNFTNQYITETGTSGWQGLQANGSGTVTAGYSKTSIRDNTNNSTSSIGFTAVTGFTGSSGSAPKAAGTNASVFCVDLIVQHTWISTATTNTFKLTNLTPGKYYQIGILSNTVAWLNVQVKFGVGANETATFDTDDNYGSCGPGDDFDDTAVKWIYNVQGDGSGEASIVLTRMAGTEMNLNAMVVLQTNIAKP